MEQSSSSSPPPQQDAHRLASELAGMWWHTLESKSWPQRLSVLNQLHEQLLEDLGNFNSFCDVSPMAIRELIERLGFSTISSSAQAHIYANSADEKHRREALVWFEAERKRAQN